MNNQFVPSPLADNAIVVSVTQPASPIANVGGQRSGMRKAMYQSTAEFEGSKAAFLKRIPPNDKPYTALSGGDCINHTKLVPFGPDDYPPALGPGEEMQRRLRRNRTGGGAFDLPDTAANTPVQPTLVGLS